MSKISQELKVLLYLNQRYTRTRWVSIKEIAEYLEISDRQARRYLEDLNLIPEIEIETKLGRDGGYRLKTPLDKGFAMPENIVLAMSIAMKRNERIESVLSKLPNYVITDTVIGNDKIENEVLDHLEVIISAIQNQKQIGFYYKEIDRLYLVDPYKVVLTNHTYYLFAHHEEIIKKFDVSYIHDLKQYGSFKPLNKINEEIEDKLKRYGIKNDKETILRVKCKDLATLLIFDRYFEGKGIKDLEELTYTVVGSSENELYYPLFRIGVKKHPYRFLDPEFKKNYIKYLNTQITALEEISDEK